jgi:predicted dehydrogenase
MRFALLGDHPDGLAFAKALVESARHQLAAYSGSALGRDTLRRWGVEAPSVGDVEEILADPAVDAVIVAGKPADRPAQLRRALQSERHVLCVHPADDSPDIAYEAAMLQGDVRVVLLPLLAETLHPGVRQLARLVRATTGPRLVEVERWSTEAALLETDTPGQDPAIPGWDVLRLLGGEIVEVVGLARTEEVAPEDTLLLSGRFERGGLFRATLLPHHAENRLRVTVQTELSRLTLLFPDGWPGIASLTWQDDDGRPQEASWPAWNPWPAMVEVFEAAVAPAALPAPVLEVAAVASEHVTSATGLGGGLVQVRSVQAAPAVRWQDAVRCLELDDAARRSVERRRASTLEYQEVTEEAGFKGTMTLVGCALVWGSLLMLLLAVWLPFLAWLILPMFGVFLALQLLRWIVPPKEPPAPRPSATPPTGPPGVP